jgi:O-antigen/teichoic acid export membrane protein
MSTFRAAFRGTTWALSTQVVTGVGLIAYSAVTARIFSPSAFGEFTAALSFNALIVLCAATGLSSFVLKEPRLHRSQVRAINLAAFSVALPSAAIFWFVSPVWLSWLNCPGGTEFVPLLTWATFAGPIGAVQQALMRREGNGRADAAVLLTAFIVATGLATVCAIVIRQSWTLALSAAISPMILIALPPMLRRAVYPVEPGWLAFNWIRFALRVVAQNLVFFGLGQVPAWSLGATATPATLGQFSRGNILAYLPYYALVMALANGIQPHWRKIETNEARIRGVSEVLTLGATLSFTSFAALAALSHPLTSLWLGPGWELAAHFTTWLATGYAMFVPTGLLSNFLEMAGELSRIQWIQLASAVGLALGVALLVWLHDFRFLLAGFVLSNLLGLVTAVWQVSVVLGTRSVQLLKQLVVPLVLAICVGTVAYVAAHLVALGMGEGTTLGNVAQLCSGTFSAIVLVFLTRKWQPAFSILVARGVLKRA